MISADNHKMSIKMSIKNCIICGNNNNAEIYLRYKDFEIIYCKKCNLYYQQTKRQEVMGEIYNNIYQKNPPNIQNKYYWKDKAKSIYKDISVYRNKPGSLLDAGCSYGLLMEYFISKGWKATGIDICENAISHARNKGLDCQVASADSFSNGDKFDVIIMDNTLEHFEDPIKSLVLLKNMLSSDGIIYIGVPNVDSVLLPSRFKDFLGNLKPFEHFFYFSKSALESLLNTTGLDVYVKTDNNVSLADVLNCYFRSKVAAKDYWQNLNYRVSADKKKTYFLFKHIYGEIMSILGKVQVGPRDRELVAILKNKGE